MLGALYFESIAKMDESLIPCKAGNSSYSLWQKNAIEWLTRKVDLLVVVFFRSDPKSAGGSKAATR